jgi:xanthine dehydrogenase iron-sulfur cluster and FAD-binding subunit A
MQLGDSQLQQYDVEEQHWVPNDIQQQEEQTVEQQQLGYSSASSGCERGLTRCMQQLQDVWNKATGTLVRNRGALQGQLASRCG